jgi:4-hydroxybenzoate polyprenyltransferase/phosphoserine phosphatase
MTIHGLTPSIATDKEIPLCVDMDGTLVRTDCLWEAAVQILFHHSSRLAGILLGCWRGKAWIKRQIAQTAALPVASLPYNKDVISLITQAKSAGRKAILITASDQVMADGIAAHLKLFDEVIGSDGVTNLKGPAKAELLVKKFGRGGFDYAGDSAADIPVWEAARRAYAVNPVPAAKRWVAQHGPEGTGSGGGTPLPHYATTLGVRRGRFGALVRALRPQHWVKNILVFLPVVAAHLWGQGHAWLLLAAFFLALCCGASAVYLINDLADIESDRRHKDKWRRPVAAGDLSIADACLAIPLLLALAFCFCSMQGRMPAELLLGYLVATSAYSFRLKKVPILDVLFLSGFYVFRIVAGAVVASVPLSEWLIAFAMFLFLSLAAAKRYVELTDLSEDKRANAARGYLPEDYPMIAAFGVNCGCMAVLVLGLYINSDTFRKLYHQAWVFWLLCLLLLYWLLRVWLLAGRRKLHEDPVDFAIKDPVTWIIAALGGLVFLIAMSGNLR